MISLLPGQPGVDAERLEACREKALSDPDPYVRNRGEVMGADGEPVPLMPMPKP